MTWVANHLPGSLTHYEGQECKHPAATTRRHTQVTINAGDTLTWCTSLLGEAQCPCPDSRTPNYLILIMKNRQADPNGEKFLQSSWSVFFKHVHVLKDKEQAGIVSD